MREINVDKKGFPANFLPEKAFKKELAWFSRVSLSGGAVARVTSQLDKMTCQVPLHPKTLFEIAMVLSTIRGSFPSNSHVSATFSILIRFGESWVPTNCEKFNADGSQMGRTNLDKSVW